MEQFVTFNDLTAISRDFFRRKEKLKIFSIQGSLLTITCSDKIGDSTRFEEGAELASRVEHIDEFDHLHETETDDRRLSVVPKTKAVHKTGPDRNNVLRIQNIHLLLNKIFA